MPRNDDLLQRQDPKDEQTYNLLVKKAFVARRKIETGFIELAESIYKINQTKLYRLKYKTFAAFCEEELGFSRQTIYVYRSILMLIRENDQFLNREKAIEFGHKKMRHITEGIRSIEQKVPDPKRRHAIKLEIFQHINPGMPSTEIEAYIEDIVDGIQICRTGAINPPIIWAISCLYLL